MVSGVAGTADVVGAAGGEPSGVAGTAGGGPSGVVGAAGGVL